MTIDLLGPDNGSVIVSDYNILNWMFTTIYEPKYGQHPVSGNREFGVDLTSNGITVFTRGVDRITSPFARPIQGFAFGVADALWESFQQGVASFVNKNGGVATIETPTIFRPNWSTIEGVINGTLPLILLSNDCP